MHKGVFLGIICLGFVVMCHASVDLLFVGVTEGGAPSFEKSFEVLLRDYFAVAPNIMLVDLNSIDRFRSKLGHGSIIPLDRANIEYMSRHGMDSTLIVWCTIRKYDLTVCRKRIFGSDLVGTAEIKVSMYFLRDKNYLYAGDVIANVHSRGPFLFFDNVKETRPSASDVVSMTESLIKDATTKTMHMISAVISARLSGEVKTAAISEAGVDRYKEPSLSDVFNVPSIEGDMLEPTPEDLAPAPSTP
jgi:hypothetical protein